MDKVPAEGPGGGTGIMGLSVAGERDRSAKRALRRRGGARSKRSVGKSFFFPWFVVCYTGLITCECDNRLMEERGRLRKEIIYTTRAPSPQTHDIHDPHVTVIPQR